MSTTVFDDNQLRVVKSVATEEMDLEDLMADALVIVKCSCFVDVFSPCDNYEFLC